MESVEGVRAMQNHRGCGCWWCYTLWSHLAAFSTSRRPHAPKVTTRYAKCRLTISLITSLHSLSTSLVARYGVVRPPRTPVSTADALSRVSRLSMLASTAIFWYLVSMIGTCHTFNPSDCFSSSLASSPLSRLPNFDLSLHALTTTTKSQCAQCLALTPVTNE